MRTLICVMLAAGALAAQQQPQPYVPTAGEKGRIEAKSTELGALLNKLEQNALYPDVAIYQKAGDFILRHPEEFVQASLREGHAGRSRQGHRSREGARRRLAFLDQEQGPPGARLSFDVDGSLQPYGLIIPESYSGQPIRLDIWMHGTNRVLNEVAFITQHETADAGAAGPGLHPGRCLRPQQCLVSLGRRDRRVRSDPVG